MKSNFRVKPVLGCMPYLGALLVACGFFASGCKMSGPGLTSFLSPQSTPAADESTADESTAEKLSAEKLSAESGSDEATAVTTLTSTNSKSGTGPKLNIAGVTPNAGPIRVALFTDASTFPNHEQAARKLIVESTAEGVSTQLSDVSQGPFALAVFQDTNNDGVLNRSSFGIPSEPYGFSRNAKGQMGPPKFQDASVNSSDPNSAISIQLEKLTF